MKKRASIVIILILISTVISTSCQKQYPTDNPTGIAGQAQPLSASGETSGANANGNGTKEDFLSYAGNNINTWNPEDNQNLKPITIDYNTLLKRDLMYSRFKLDGVNIHEDTLVDEFQRGDVNGDGAVDNVLITGVYSDKDRNCFQNFINIVIQDGKSKRLTFIPSGFGIKTSIFLGDFDGDRVKDILVGIEYSATGGAGNYSFSIYSFKNSRLSEIFNSNVHEKYEIGVDWMDDYKVKVSCPDSERSFLIDIKDKKESIKYHYDGNKLISENNGWADSYCETFPEDLDNDGVYELTGMQYVCYDFHVDRIGMAETTLKWDRRKKDWVLKNFDFYEDINEYTE